VSQIFLDQSRVCAFGREYVAATVPHHVVVELYFKFGGLCDRRECFVTPSRVNTSPVLLVIIHGDLTG
jgi:hypothetical protein